MPPPPPVPTIVIDEGGGGQLLTTTQSAGGEGGLGSLVSVPKPKLSNPPRPAAVPKLDLGRRLTEVLQLASERRAESATLREEVADRLAAIVPNRVQWDGEVADLLGRGRVR